MVTKDEDTVKKINKPKIKNKPITIKQMLALGVERREHEKIKGTGTKQDNIHKKEDMNLKPQTQMKIQAKPKMKNNPQAGLVPKLNNTVEHSKLLISNKTTKCPKILVKQHYIRKLLDQTKSKTRDSNLKPRSTV